MKVDETRLGGIVSAHEQKRQKRFLGRGGARKPRECMLQSQPVKKSRWEAEEF